jgi:RNA polymerase sigma-70 factor, ECF subfamily
MDVSLIRAAQSGDREAFERIAAQLGRPFLATSRRILHDLDLAEDATQEALVGIWHGLPRLRDPERFEAWAYRLLIRACHAEGSKVRHWAPNLQSLALEPAATSDDVEGVVDRDQLDRAFRRLSIDHRTVVVLRYYLDLPHDQIAQILGVSAGTVASRLHYAVEGMRSAVHADAREPFREAMP